MSTELVSERHLATTTLTLNRPEKANALNAAVVEALLDAFETAARDGTRLLVLKGNGRNFCAGFDFGGLEDASEGDLLLRFVRMETLLQAVYHAPFATLALAHGKNFGAGVDLILACGTRIGTTDSAFRMPGLKFGLQLGTRRLAARLGGDAARALLATSRTFSGEEAAKIGFLHRLAQIDDWPGLITAAGDDAGQLSPAAAARLFAATVTESRAADMADLVASAAEPGVKERIREYRKGG